MKEEIRFGTDGWRAVIAEGFTFANVARVAQATADFWRDNPVPGTDRRVVVGFDRRFLSDQFALRTAEILAANGFQVLLTPDPTPTPSVSYAVPVHRAVGGIMITASHNPAAFNGFKLKAHYGGPADPELCRHVEARLDANPVPSISERVQRRVRRLDVRPEHFRAIRERIDFKRVAQARIRFAHDALYGVGAGCFEALLRGTRCRVTTLRGEHDPNFGGISPEPIRANYGQTAAWLRGHPHDVCVVTDGDADRIGAMDGRGGYLSTHQVIALLLHHLVENRQGRGRVVKALTTTSMVDRMCEAFGLSCTETAVGFKHVTAEMLKGDVLLGAEESGGIGLQGHIPERDGLLAGLMLLELLVVESKSPRKLLGSLERRFGPHHYVRRDLAYPLGKRAALMEYCQRRGPDRLLRSPVKELKAYDGVKYIAANGSWLMLRGSGTEPVLRIYAEAASEAEAERLIRVGTRLARQV